MCRIDLSRSLFRCLILTSCLALLVTGCCTARYQGYGPYVAGYDGGAGCSDCDGGGCASCGPVFPRSCGSCLGGCGGLSGILMPLLGNRMACGSGCGSGYWNEWVSDPPACDPCNECGQWTGGGYGNGGCGAGGCGGACWNGAVGRGPFPIIGGIVRGALRFTGSLLHTVLYGYHGPYPGHGGCMSCDSSYEVEDPYSWGQGCSGGGCSSGCSSCMNGGDDGEYIEDGGEYYNPSSEPDMVPTPAEVPADELPPSAARRPNSPRATNTPRSARNRMANPRMRR